VIKIDELIQENFFGIDRIEEKRYRQIVLYLTFDNLYIRQTLYYQL